ncbi:MAG: SGNH/GDSL hydrolase family protein [Gemmatimonadetes bacterium]|nr:SGNH/GDSL hydrolase family protein [Gemmatimonadota bacterium]NNM06632.1 SGNH/GDSL hydrolase family protein [Gemmatimonadota bacterium]
MDPDSAKFLALGDSYTIGESVEPFQRWPVQLAARLTNLGVPTEDPRIIARTGWTTDELSAGIVEAGIRGTYDIVSLLIGVNNQYRGRDLEEYRSEFLDLLSQAVAFAGGDPKKVLVLSIPDWGVTPFAEGRDRVGIATEIDAFNAVNRIESESAGVSYLDITPISREAASNPGLIADDGLHPSGAMYARWAEAALPYAVGILGPAPGGG